MISEKRILHDFVSECFRFQFEGSPEAESILGTVGLIPVEKASLTGVRQAVADCVEMLIDLEGDRLGALNEQLSSHGVPRSVPRFVLLQLSCAGCSGSDEERKCTLSDAKRLVYGSAKNLGAWEDPF
jgi:hypothetical protein